MMDIPVLVKEYLSNHASIEVALLRNPSRNYLIIDYVDLLNHDLTLAEALLEKPEDVMKTFNTQLTELLYTPGQDVTDYYVLFTNIIQSKTDIWKVRKEHVGKFTTFEGMIQKITNPLSKPKQITYECPNCHTQVTMITEVNDPPIKCGCGRKGKFLTVNTIYKHEQYIILQEDVEELGTDRPPPRSILLILKEPLTNPEFDACLKGGGRVKAYGILKIRFNSKEGTHDPYLDVNMIEVEEVGYEQIKITPEEEAQIRKDAERPAIVDELAESLNPYHKYDTVLKKTLFLSLVGSKKILGAGGVLKERGTVNILMIGNPGSGKSQLLRNTLKYSPIHRYVSCSSSSAIGITATIEKDKTLDMYVPSAGVLPICNKGVAGIDEIDKLDKEELGKLNTAMTELQIPLNKANVHTVFETDTTILAGCNPLGKVFNPEVIPEQQINLPEDFKDRFDIIWPLPAKQTEEQVRTITNSIISAHYTSPEQPRHNRDYLIKYIALARRHTPEISVEVGDYASNLIMDVNRKSKEHFTSNRLTSNTLRLAYAFAKVKFKNVTEDEINQAISLLLESYKARGVLQPDGTLNDIEIMNIPDPVKRGKLQKLHDVLSKLRTEYLGIEVDGEVFEKRLQEELQTSYYETKDIIKKLEQDGDLFHPRPSVTKFM